jgi:hypothetical protein
MSDNKTFSSQDPRHSSGRYWPWLAIFIVILSAAVIRIHLLEVPLERDEGEYAYAGQLMLQGVPPYDQVYNMKMPGIYVAYALIMAVFGQTHSSIHSGLLIMNAATTMLLFLLGRRLFDTVTGITAAAAFALFSLGQPVQGIFANAEHFVLLPALGGILLLVYKKESKNLLILLTGGMLLGLGFLMKQHGAAFVAFAGLYVLINELRRKPLEWKPFFLRLSVFSFSVLLPFVITCIILWQAGVFEKFRFWTFDYAREYVSAVPLSAGISNLKRNVSQIMGSSLLLWGLAGFGLTALAWDRHVRRHALFAAGFFLFSFLAICPGFYFRPHYFILFLPGAALLSGIGAGSLYRIFSRNSAPLAIKAVPVLLIVGMVFHGIWQQRNFLFLMGPVQASRSTYGLNPFPESLEIARFLRDQTEETDRIAVVGSEPQIYFYSKRRSATGYVYTYALMEVQPFALKMQQEMIREIEAGNPRFLIYVNIPTSWLVRPQSEKKIFTWFYSYTWTHYDLVGVIDIGFDRTVYRWFQQASNYRPKSPYWLTIHRRKD